MKPYFETELGKLYHGDCLEILPKLGPVDLVLTDPPYGVAFSGKATKHTTKKSGGYDSQDSREIGPEVIKYALSIPSSKRMVVFPGNNNAFSYPPPNDIGCVYCPSGAGIGKWGFTCFHIILFYGPRYGNKLQPTSFQSFAVAKMDGHPCPKPVLWMTEILRKFSSESEFILDMFLGSGTTAVACERLGRKWIGIEISEQYCEVAAKRIQAEAAQIKLFA